MSCNCETGKFPIKIIQGDSYRRVYKFYDADGNIIDNTNLATVYFTCARLNYSTSLKYNTDDEGWVLYFTSDTTKEFAYCKSDYDLTLYFTDRQISTQIYRSEFRVCEKKMFPVVEVSGEGEYVNVDDITTDVYTNIIIGGGIADHSILLNRNLPNQHPMGAITGLEEALEGKQATGDYATTQELDELANIVDSKANASDIPTKTSDLTNDSDFTTKTYVDGIDTNLQGQIDDLQAEKMPLTEIDTTPTEGSTNLVESGGVYDAVENIQTSLQEQIDAIVSSSDVKDVVGTYAELQSYDTSTLGNNDIVKVLNDSTHNNARSYYRWVISGNVGSWVYIGSEAISYTKSEADALLAQKQNVIADLTTIRSGASAGATALQDAPKDGKQYTRKDGVWSEVVSGDKSAIIIPYASLGVTPYTFAEVKALLDAGNEVKVQTDSYIPHCTSYSNDIITFFDITSWDLGAGVYNITYVHLRSNNAKYTYNEQEHLNPVVYARIAPNYSATSDYTIGDYCTRYENIYRCTTAISGGEEWNSSHWVAVTVMGEIQQSTIELKEDLDSLDDRVTELEQHGGGISDAPIDGKQYARQNGAWSEINQSEESLIVDIPYDDLGTNDYTYTKLSEMLEQGKILRVIYSWVGGSRYLWCKSQYVDSGSPLLMFLEIYSVDQGVGTIEYMYVTLRNNNVKSKGTSTMPLIAKSMYISDIGNYYTTDTVEGALQEIGSTLNGLEDAINIIRGVS